MAGSIDVGTAAALGAVQGLTEFLPVSSDGHIAIGAMIFGVSDEVPLTLVVLLHTGTLLATVIVLWSDIAALAKSTVRGVFTQPREFFKSDDGKLVLGIVAASIPTAIIGLLLEDPVEAWARVPWIVGACLLGSAIAVAATRFGGGDKDVLPLWKTLLVGFAQGLAVLPGLTRSGMTIATGMMLGLSGPAAFRFSFLLSLPAISGATVLMLSREGALSELRTPAFVGALVALVVGYAALRLLRALVNKGRFWVFAIYLVPLGIGLIVWDLSSTERPKFAPDSTARAEVVARTLGARYDPRDERSDAVSSEARNAERSSERGN